MALSNVSWDLYLSRQYFSRNVFLETALSHISWALYRSGTELNTKGLISTDLIHISWVLYRIQKKLYCRRNIGSFITHYWVLQQSRTNSNAWAWLSTAWLHTFWFLQSSGTDFYVPQFSRISLLRISWVFHWLETYHFMNEIFLTACLHIFLL